MKTYVPKRGELVRDWWVVDADGQTLGRLATQVAVRLLGKHKPTFTPNLDTGDHVVVINADKVALTGAKEGVKMYRRYSGYPGGLKETAAFEMRQKHPTRIVEIAVKGMLPKGPLGRRIARKLKVYAGAEHPHEAQKPRRLDVDSVPRQR
jgi:large subunit ribosomal protein L13